MRRKDKEITEPGAMEEILKKAEVGRIAFCDGDEPYLVPVNFGYADGKIYVHSAKEGRKIGLVRGNPRVCFEAETDVEPIRGETPCNWSMRYRSVICTGRARLIEDEGEKVKGLEVILARYMPGPFDLPESATQRIVVIEIEITSMTGKASGF